MQIEWTPTSEIDRLQAAIDTHWRKGHVLAHDAELLRWQYRNPRHTDRLSVLQATENGRLVGMLGLIQADFNVLGRRLPALWLATWFAAADAPGATGLALLREALSSDAKVVACLGFNDTAERIYRALRFSVIDAVPRWVRVIHPDALGRLLAHGDGRFAEALQDLSTAASGRRSAKSPESLRIVPASAEAEEKWDRAWAASFAPRLLGTWRDSAYLHWRYLEHPCFEYRLLFARDESEGALRGIVVYRLERVQESNECVVRIVELLGERAATRLLVATVVDEAHAADAAFVDFFGTLSALAPALEECGFVRDDALPASLPMLFQPLDFHRNRVRAAIWMADDVLATAGNGRDALLDQDTLYVTRSDGDQDRPN